MSDELNSVKTRSRYHHGDLRAALVTAAEGLLAERGADGFSLREAARRAGVSPAAPAHHFGDARGLLTAVAAQAFRDLADALETDPDAPRHDRLRAQGVAYIRFALANQARFDLMWRLGILDCDDADYQREGARAFRLLDRTVRGPEAPERAKDHPDMAPTFACWSMVHGFARLAMEGPMGGVEPTALEAMLGGVLQHLRV